MVGEKRTQNDYGCSNKGYSINMYNVSQQTEGTDFVNKDIKWAIEGNGDI